MGAAAQTVTEAPAGVGPRARVCAIAAVLVASTVGGVVTGRADRSARRLGASVVRDRVPVGVLHSRAGALAAADDYLLVDQESIEQAPGRYAELVRETFAPRLQAPALAQAAAVRARDRAGMALWAEGGRAVSLIGAHRLDRYGSGRALVTCWVGTVYWGPGQPPKQAWSLAHIRLAWIDGRWRVTGLLTSSPDPAPVPALTPQAAPANDTTRQFDSSLAGFTSIDPGAVVP